VKFTPNSPISLSPAAPGWYVEHSTDKGSNTFPIIAWAVVSQGYDEDGGMDTTVEPVFLFQGTPYTASEWYRDMGPKYGIEVIAP
jgi:hypothetical protein